MLYAPGLLALVSAARSVAASIATNDSHRNLCRHPGACCPFWNTPACKIPTAVSGDATAPATSRGPATLRPWLSTQTPHVGSRTSSQRVI